MKISEEQRLAALNSLEILDTEPEKDFDEITNLVAQYLQVPIVAVSLVDKDRQWFKSKVGLPVTETPRDISFCTHAIQGEKAYIVKDAQSAPLFMNSPLVTGAPNIRFYAGSPLKLSTGENIGTICAIDTKARELTSSQIEFLNIISRQVTRLIEFKKINTIQNQIINQKKEDQKKLTETVRQLHVLVENIPAGVAAVDIYGKILFLNKSFCKTFQIEKHPKDMVGQPIKNIFLNISEYFIKNEDFLSRIQALTRSEKHVLGDQIQFHDGRHFERDYVRIIKNNADLGHIWMFRDVTENREAQKTIEVQRLQLLESAKLRALGEMAGGLAHEINNPLAVIQGRASMLLNMADKNQLTNEIIKKYSENINNVVHRIVKIIKALRSFAREGAQDPLETISLQQIIEDTLVFCNTKLKNLSIELKYSPAQEPLNIQSRPTQISQIILNLLNNACDAIENESQKWVQIEILEDQNHYYIAVTNSGARIKQEIVENIFNPFFTTKGPKGTGMGLSISKRIAESNNAKLWLDTTSEHTCFKLSFQKA